MLDAIVGASGAAYRFFQISRFWRSSRGNKSKWPISVRIVAIGHVSPLDPRLRPQVNRIGARRIRLVGAIQLDAHVIEKLLEIDVGWRELTGRTDR